MLAQPKQMPQTQWNYVPSRKLAAKVEESRVRREKITAPAKKLYDRLEKVVGTFCPGLAKAPLHIHRFGASHHHH